MRKSTLPKQQAVPTNISLFVLLITVSIMSIDFNFSVFTRSKCFKRLCQSTMQRFVGTKTDRPVTRVGIVGVPFSKGQRLSGVASGPHVIRKGGLIEEINEFNPWADIKDYGDVHEHVAEIPRGMSVPQNMPNYAVFAGTMQRLSEKVLDVYRDNRMCWTLGGDHSIAVGKIIIWLLSNSNWYDEKNNDDFCLFRLIRLGCGTFAPQQEYGCPLDWCSYWFEHKSYIDEWQHPWYARRDFGTRANWILGRFGWNGMAQGTVSNFVLSLIVAIHTCQSDFMFTSYLNCTLFKISHRQTWKK